MPRFTPRTKAFVMPDLVDRFPAPGGGPVGGNPPDGYVITYSATDGYYFPKPTSKLLVFSSPSSSPYSVALEDTVLVQNHAGTFTVNLPVGPQPGFNVIIKDFAGVALANPINVAAAALIDGATPYVINVNYGAVRVMYNGTTWSIVGKF